MSGDGSYRLGRVLLTRDEITRRVGEVAREIVSEYEGRQVVVLGVLRGAFVFLADLVREIGDELDIAVEFIGISSYGSSTDSSGSVRLTKGLDASIEGRHVLIVEDIADTGHSLQYLQKEISDRRPASLRTCVFLDKPERREVDVRIDHICFSIPDEFVVGYGLDVAEKWRQLPDVRCVEAK